MFGGHNIASMSRDRQSVVSRHSAFFYVQYTVFGNRTITSVHRMKKELSQKQRKELLDTLKGRFDKNMNRHKGLEWTKVQTRLEADSGKLWSLGEMVNRMS